jgi:hypothetical protein
VSSVDNVHLFDAAWSRRRSNKPASPADDTLLDSIATLNCSLDLGRLTE